MCWWFSRRPSLCNFTWLDSSRPVVKPTLTFRKEDSVDSIELYKLVCLPQRSRLGAAADAWAGRPSIYPCVSNFQAQQCCRWRGRLMCRVIGWNQGQPRVSSRQTTRVVSWDYVRTKSTESSHHFSKKSFPAKLENTFEIFILWEKVKKTICKKWGWIYNQGSTASNNNQHSSLASKSI